LCRSLFFLARGSRHNSFDLARVFSDAHVRFGSGTDIEVPSSDVRFAPESRHRLSAFGCLLSAKSGHAGYCGSRLTCCPTTTGSMNVNVEP
jgi:hypothetical protein